MAAFTAPDTLIFVPPPMDDRPLANQLLTEDSISHYLTEETWEEKDDTKKWARERGKLIRCIIVCNGTTNDSAFQMVCECSGKHKSHAKKDTLQVAKTKRKNITFSKKTGCPFKLQFKRNKAKRWFLEKVVCGNHNHPIPESLLSHAYARRLTKEEENIVESLTQIRMKPIDILAHLKERNPQNDSNLDNIYNARKNTMLGNGNKGTKCKN
ncbi:uncharacterized protein LOC113291778 [Papaver somniferum]|uniref:uncharacterized protein LOC113291778 n=1 Tax=Papaver somniferum TaxID=3469 RepID=UPI000E6FE21C|nr:uncharacterized protein LOC113291778 [Papaver somniferum]